MYTPKCRELLSKSKCDHTNEDRWLFRPFFLFSSLDRDDTLRQITLRNHDTTIEISKSLECSVYKSVISKPVSIQTQSFALRFTQQTQAPANRNARSKHWQPWLAACQRKRLRFLWFSFTQLTQRKRLRLNGNRAYSASTLPAFKRRWRRSSTELSWRNGIYIGLI